MGDCHALCTKMLTLLLPLLALQAASLKFDSNATLPRVLFTIASSDKPNLAERVPAQLNTWAKNLHQDELLILGRSPVKGKENMATWEPRACQDNHELGLVCKEAMMITLAHRAQPDWAIIANDDHYIIADRMKAALAKEDPSKPQILGIVGCAAGPGCSGMCGGGTIIISRAALNKMTEAGEKPYQDEEMRYAKHECKGWSDQSTSAVAKHHGVKLRNIGGLMGWRWQNNNVLNTWLRNSNLISMHYVSSAADMFMIDKRLKQAGFVGLSQFAVSTNEAETSESSARASYIAKLNRCQYSKNAADFVASDCDA